MEVGRTPAVLRVVLVDINPRVVDAWRAAFADAPEVEVVRGSILDRRVDAWVTPTNSHARMDGGVDAAVKGRLGAGVERRVRDAVARDHGGFLPVGAATCVPTGAAAPRFLISAPTMTTSGQDIRATLNVALACAAAFQAVHMQNAREPGSIGSIALPGLGAATGRVPPRVCADLMWTAYRLFGDYEFRSFEALAAAVREHLGGVDAAPETARVRVTLSPPADPFDSPWTVR